jgi:hypothetical protein
MLRRFRYESTVVYIADDGTGSRVVHGAVVRTESRALDGARRIVLAVGGSHARETAETLLAS